MKCPKCTSTECKKNGTNSAGTQRYCCKVCNCTFVLNAHHGGHNRIDDGKTPQQRQNDKRKLQRKERCPDCKATEEP